MSDKLHTLSKAIRVGSTMSKQAFGAWKRQDERCALQAALHAVTMITGEIEVTQNTDYLKKRFNLLGLVSCPYCKGKKEEKRRSPTSLVIHLNDDHKFSREKIAAFLESIGF